MRREEFTFKSKDGTSDIHAVKWMPDNVLEKDSGK